MARPAEEPTITEYRSVRSAIALSLALFLLLVLVSVAVTGWYRARAIADARASLTLDLSAYAQALTTSVSTRLAVQRGLNEYAAVESRAGIDPAEFDAFATGLRSSTGGITSVHIAPDGVVRYVSPKEYEADLMGRDLVHDPRPGVAEGIARAINSGQMVATGPYEMLTGPYGIVTRQAVHNADGSLWGITSVQIELAPLLKESGVVGSSPGFDLAVRSSVGTMVAGSADVFDADPITYDIAVADQTWTLAGAPTDGWESVVSGQNWRFVFGFAVMLSALVALTTYWLLSQRARLQHEVEERTGRMAEMNTRLASDLQALKSADETLRSSEERFRRLWEGSPLPVIGARAGVVVLANQAIADLLGYSGPDDVIGLAETDLAAPSKRRELAQRARNRLAGEDEPTSFESLAYTSDGVEIPVRVTVVVLDLPDGPLIITFVTDMTEQLNAERVLRESAAQYRVLFENSPVALFEEDFSEARRFMLDLEVPAEELRDYLLGNPDVLAQAVAGMKVERVNRTTMELWGARDASELRGGLDPYVLEVNQELYVLELLAVAKGEQRFFGAAEMPALDGRMMFANIYWNVAPGYEDTFGKVFVSIIDLSDQRRMQLQLERYKDSLETLVEERTAELTLANRELVEATKAKDKFLAAMSHELRTPLNSIIGFSGTLLQGLAGELNEEQQRQLSHVERSGRHLLRLINQVLDLARIEAGQEEPELETFEVAALVGEVLGDVTPLAEEKSLTLASDTEEAPDRMHGDRDRLKQIILNLLSNAIKFTVNGEVRLAASAQADMVVFRVSDTGPGIPFDEQTLVFESFHQMRTEAGHKPAGTGLGLSISRELAHLLGGEITLESTPGEGSCFIVRMPITAGSAAEPEPEATGEHPQRD